MLNLSEKLKLKSLYDGKSLREIFLTGDETTTKSCSNANVKNGRRLCSIAKLSIPRSRCDFKNSIESRDTLNWECLIDHSATVSLALVHRHSTILREYANKLPIMCLNVSRFTYTVEAFYFKNPQNSNCITDALEFYLRTDIKNRNHDEPPNQQFSNFLHRLKSNGYEDYVFDLAEHLNLNVDLIYEPKILYRYLRSSSSSTSVNGFITAYCSDGTRWYVKTTSQPLATERIKSTSSSTTATTTTT